MVWFLPPHPAEDLVCLILSSNTQGLCSCHSGSCPHHLQIGQCPLLSASILAFSRGHTEPPCHSHAGVEMALGPPAALSEWTWPHCHIHTHALCSYSALGICVGRDLHPIHFPEHKLQPDLRILTLSEASLCSQAQV